MRFKTDTRQIPLVRRIAIWAEGVLQAIATAPPKDECVYVPVGVAPGRVKPNPAWVDASYEGKAWWLDSNASFAGWSPDWSRMLGETDDEYSHGLALDSLEAKPELKCQPGWHVFPATPANLGRRRCQCGAE